MMRTPNAIREDAASKYVKIGIILGRSCTKAVQSRPNEKAIMKL